MFSDKEIQAYKKISAPPEVLCKIKSSTENRKVFPRMAFVRAAGALAACVAIVIALAIFLRTPSPDIVCNGQELSDSIVFYDITPASDMRESTVFSVPFELYLSEDTDISVSFGNLVDADGETLEKTLKKGKVEALWLLNGSDRPETCEMVLEGKKNTTVITLIYDENNKSVNVTKSTK